MGWNVPAPRQFGWIFNSVGGHYLFAAAAKVFSLYGHDTHRVRTMNVTAAIWASYNNGGPSASSEVRKKRTNIRVVMPKDDAKLSKNGQ